MPSVTNTDKIRALELSVTTLVERIDNLREDLRRHEELASDVSKQTHEIDRRFSVIDHRVSAIEKKLDELLSRRWDLWKLILAAFLGSILAVGAGLVSRSLEHLIPTLSKQASPARTADEQKK